MQDIIEIREKLAKFYVDSKYESYSRPKMLRIIRDMIHDLDKDIKEYDQYVDQMAFAEEQYFDRMVSA